MISASLIHGLLLFSCDGTEVKRKEELESLVFDPAKNAERSINIAWVN